MNETVMNMNNGNPEKSIVYVAIPAGDGFRELPSAIFIRKTTTTTKPTQSRKLEWGFCGAALIVAAVCFVAFAESGVLTDFVRRHRQVHRLCDHSTEGNIRGHHLRGSTVSDAASPTGIAMNDGAVDGDDDDEEAAGYGMDGWYAGNESHDGWHATAHGADGDESNTVVARWTEEKQDGMVPRLP